MSKYTTELRFICENLCGYTDSQGLSKVEEIITKSAPLIFDFDYPIFDEDYKIPLEKKILRHYYLREIGFETLGVWKLKLNDKMNEIMPYFNQLYKSELLKFNPLIDVDVKTTSNTAGTGNTDFSQTDTKNTTETETKKDTFSSAEHSEFELTKSGTASGDSTSEDKNDGTLTNSSSSTNSGSTSNSSTLTNSSSSTNSGSTSDSSTSSKTYNDNDDYSDTPQGSVGNLNNLTYLTNARHKHGNSEDTTTAKGTSSGELKSSSTDTTTAKGNSSGEVKSSSTDTSKITAKNTATSKETTSGNDTSTNDKTFNSTDNVNSSRNGTATGDVSSNTNTTNTQDYVENIIGKRGAQTYSAMLNEFRKTFLNIDAMILDELSELFMTIY